MGARAWLSLPADACDASQPCRLNPTYELMASLLPLPLNRILPPTFDLSLRASPTATSIIDF